MKKRIEKAKQLLENSKYTITRFAIIIGLSSAAHFASTTNIYNYHKVSGLSALSDYVNATDMQNLPTRLMQSPFYSTSTAEHKFYS
ncbi:hypothetical protein [Paenibacillus sp. O199]|uniref:hypothetical protein n=1 Tax=Paenibacillus sp. O199 TaxID=1643925 RepID=UPI000AA578B0|nr:hypothetical protein [Paenibacillus sp. O199]